MAVRIFFIACFQLIMKIWEVFSFPAPAFAEVGLKNDISGSGYVGGRVEWFSVVLADLSFHL